MRLAIAHPCFGSSETVLRIKRSSVPWTKSFGFAILWLSTIRIVDCQGVAIRGYSATATKNSAPRSGLRVSRMKYTVCLRDHDGIEGTESRADSVGRTQKA